MAAALKYRDDQYSIYCDVKDTDKMEALIDQEKVKREKQQKHNKIAMILPFLNIIAILIVATIDAKTSIGTNSIFSLFKGILMISFAFSIINLFITCAYRNHEDNDFGQDEYDWIKSLQNTKINHIKFRHKKEISVIDSENNYLKISLVHITTDDSLEDGVILFCGYYDQSENEYAVTHYISSKTLQEIKVRKNRKEGC